MRSKSGSRTRDVCEVSTATIKYRTFYFWNRLVVVRWWFLMFGG